MFTPDHKITPAYLRNNPDITSTMMLMTGRGFKFKGFTPELQRKAKRKGWGETQESGPAPVDATQRTSRKSTSTRSNTARLGKGGTTLTGVGGEQNTLGAIG